MGSNATVSSLPSKFNPFPKSVCPLAGLLLKVVPLQTIVDCAGIDGVGLTVTVTLNGVPAQAYEEFPTSIIPIALTGVFVKDCGSQL